jgi:hypothetical protein
MRRRQYLLSSERFVWQSRTLDIGSAALETIDKQAFNIAVQEKIPAAPLAPFEFYNAWHFSPPPPTYSPNPMQNASL